jgi:hypothetical protein
MEESIKKTLAQSSNLPKGEEGNEERASVALHVENVKQVIENTKKKIVKVF